MNAEYKIKFENLTQVRRLLNAFTALYGKDVHIEAAGTINTTDGDYVFARNWSGGRVEVKSIGRRYLTIIADGEPCKVDMKSNHGVELLLVKSNV